MSDFLSALPDDVLYYICTEFLCPPDTATHLAKCGCTLTTTQSIKLSKMCRSKNVQPTIAHFLANRRISLVNLNALMSTSQTIHDKLVASRTVDRLVTLLCPHRPTAVSYLVARGHTIIYKCVHDVHQPVPNHPVPNLMLRHALDNGRLGSARQLHGIVGYQRSQSLLKLRFLLQDSLDSFVICCKLNIPIHYEHVLELLTQKDLWGRYGNDPSLLNVFSKKPSVDMSLILCLLFKKRFLIEWMIKNQSALPTAANPKLQQFILRSIILKIKDHQVPALQDMCQSFIQPTFGTLRYAVFNSNSLFAFQTLFFYFGRPLTPTEADDIVLVAIQKDRLAHLVYLEKFATTTTSNLLVSALFSKSWRIVDYYAQRGVQLHSTLREQVRERVPLDTAYLTEAFVVTLLKVKYFEGGDDIYCRAITGNGDLVIHLAKSDMDFLRWCSTNVSRILAFQNVLISRLP